LLVPRLAPCDLDEPRALDTHEVTTDDHPIDVDRKEPTAAGFKPREVAHPPNQQFRVGEMVKDTIRLGGNLDSGPVRFVSGCWGPDRAF
jgi:hypothetical protein